MSWKSIVEFESRFWWWRGIAAALSITGVIPNYTPLERLEFLRVFHAIIVGWDDVAEFFGMVIGKVLHIPDIPADMVSAFIFSLVVLPPVSAYLWGRIDQEVTFPKSFEGNIFAEIIHKSLFPRTRNYFHKAVLVFLLLSYPTLTVTVMSFDLELGRPVSAFLILFSLIGACLFVVACVKIKQFGRGIVFFLSLTLSLEVLYYLNLPVVSDSIYDFTCKVLEDCK